MKRPIGAGAVAVLMLAGCGSNAKVTTTSNRSPTANRAGAAVTLLKSTGAKPFYAPGRPAITAAQCRAAGQSYSCLMTYQATAPNGTRNVLRMTISGRVDRLPGRLSRAQHPGR